MKRSEAKEKLAERLVSMFGIEERGYLWEASNILDFLEELGMRPPRLPEEDCQAILTTYYAGYTLNQWEEDFAKDEKAQEAKRVRAENEARREEYLKEHGTMKGFLRSRLEARRAKK